MNVYVTLTRFAAGENPQSADIARVGPCPFICSP